MWKQVVPGELTPEQEARDLLERLDHPHAQELSAGDVVELANLIHMTKLRFSDTQAEQQLDKIFMAAFTPDNPVVFAYGLLKMELKGFRQRQGRIYRLPCDPLPQGFYWYRDVSSGEWTLTQISWIFAGVCTRCLPNDEGVSKNPDCPDCRGTGSVIHCRVFQFNTFFTFLEGHDEGTILVGPLQPPRVSFE